MFKPFDFVSLLVRMPRAWPIFLRREYEKFAVPLRWMARIYRRTLLADTRLAVVVGSVGKTTTRRVLHAALACPDRGFSYSNYGASLAGNVLRVRPGDKHAVIEAGVGGPGWMGVYSRFLQPDIVVVTSIKSDHYRSFPSLEHTREEKVRIVRELGADKVVFLNGDDPHVRWMATQTHAKVVTFGLGEDNDARAVDVRNTADGLRFDALLGTRRISVQVCFVGEHMVYPFLASLAVAEWEGGDLAAAVARFREIGPEDSRMELIRSPAGITFLDDSYKCGVETVHVALEAMAQLPASRRVFLFGGVEDPPGKQGDINREIGRRMAWVADLVFLLGNRKTMSGLRAGAVEAGLKPENVHIIGSDIHAAIPVLARELRSGDVMLVKGRNTQRLRRIVLRLLGREVRCAVEYCGVKVTSCDVCPLLNAAPEWFANHYIARDVRLREVRS